MLTLELERETVAILDDAVEAAAAGATAVVVVAGTRLGTTMEAVPELSWLNVYECQFPNSSWKQCTAPSDVSSWSVAKCVPGFPPTMLEILEGGDEFRRRKALLTARRRRRSSSVTKFKIELEQYSI